MGTALIAAAGGLAACASGTAPVIGRDCGAVSKGARVVGDPSGPEGCLWQAWMGCQSATLVYTTFGVDTGKTHTHTVQPVKGACEVQDAVQGYSANGGGSRSLIVTYACASLERAPDGGLVARGCGEEGDLTILPMAELTPSGPQASTPATTPG
jgi:hypothetical protein